MAETFVHPGKTIKNFAVMAGRETMLIFGTGLATLALAYASMQMVDASRQIAVIWLPGGFLIAALMLTPAERRPTILIPAGIALFGANMLGGLTLQASMLHALLQCAACLLIVTLLQAHLRTAFSPASLGHLLAFFFIVTISYFLLNIPITALQLPPSRPQFGLHLLEEAGADILAAATLVPLIISGAQSLKTFRAPASRASVVQQLVEWAGNSILIIFCCTIAILLLWEMPTSLLDLFLDTCILIPLLIYPAIRLNTFPLSMLYTLISLIAISPILKTHATGILLYDSTHIIIIQVYLILLGLCAFIINALQRQLKQTRERLSTSEQKYQHLIENASFGIFQLTPGSGFTLANPAFASMLGFHSPEELTQAPADLPAQLGFNLPLAAGQHEWIHSLHRFHNRDNEALIGKLSLRSVWPANGGPPYLEGFMENITGHLRADANLKNTQQHLHAIVSSAPYAIQLYALDAEGQLRLQHTNQAAATLLHQPPNSGHGKTIHELLPGLQSGTFFETCRHIAQGQTPQQFFELPYLSPEVQGEYDITAAPTGPGSIVLTIADNTLRKHSENVARARLRLLEASQSLSIEEVQQLFTSEARAISASPVGFFEQMPNGASGAHASPWLRPQPRPAIIKDIRPESWGKYISVKQPVIYNQPQAIPPLHNQPNLHRLMLVPILRQNQVICMVGMANKPFAYTPLDVSAIEQLAGLTCDICERKQTEQELRQNQERMRESEQIASVGGWEYDPARAEYHFTRGVYRIHAIPQDVTLRGDDWLGTCFPPKDRRALLEALARAVDAALPFDLELNALNRHHEPIWVRLRGNPIHENGRVVRVSGSIMDISELKSTRESLASSEEQLRLALDAASDGLWDWSCQERSIYSNPGFHSMLGYTLGQLPLRPVEWLRLVHEEDRAGLKKLGKDCLANRVRSFEIEVRMFTKDSQWQWVQLRGSQVASDEQGLVTRIIGTAVNIHERKTAELALRQSNQRLKSALSFNRNLQEKLLEAAVQDPLTGLFNRRHMNATLSRLLSGARREPSHLGLLFIDVDQFKQINDTYGHRVGDEVLVELAGLLSNSIRESDTACRYGGEEFVVIMPGATAEDATIRAETIRENFSLISLSSMRIHATLSIGVAEYPAHGVQAAELIHNADAAMYEAKRAGRNRVHLAQNNGQ